MNEKDQDLLKELCAIHAPSGSEKAVKDYLKNYIKSQEQNWKVQPTIIEGDDFQDCMMLIFGEPRTAIYAHMDSVGYSVGYENELLKIGGPKAEEGAILVGSDSKGKIRGKLHYSI